MQKTALFFVGIAFLLSCSDQKQIYKLSDSEVFKMIYDEALSSHESHQNLKYLTEKFPKRLACYPQGIEAAKWTKQVMEDMGFDKVFLQEAQVMNWKRGKQEEAYIISGKNGKTYVKTCALGRGIGTGNDGIEAGVIEVYGTEGLNRLTKKQIEGKIVFFNKPMNPELTNPFQAYVEVADQRFMGPILAAQYGAKGVIVRSLTTSIDEFPHTGTTKKAENEPTVPAVVIATKHANFLSEYLKNDPNLKFYFKTDCKNLPDTVSYNVIGEITGTEFPNEYIVVGGHLDSWDNSPGAHDDGGGCMQAIEVLRIFKKLGIKPKHSIRAVMYMDEEISQGGGRAYANQARINNEKHIAAIESDRGVTRPLGFTIDATQEKIDKIASWSNLFNPYDINLFVQGYGGVDIAPLKDLGTLLIGFHPDATNYFDWHHCANDTFDKINREEMQKGAATIAALVYLIDKYGL